LYDGDDNDNDDSDDSGDVDALSSQRGGWIDGWMDGYVVDCKVCRAMMMLR
jgi:hypothetical protein